MVLKTRIIIALVAFVCVGSTTASWAQNSAVTRATMLGLPGVSIYVDSLSSEMVEKGMTRSVFKMKILLRLQEAGIPVLNLEVDEPVPGSPTLLLSITTLFDDVIDQCTYNIRLELTQTVRLERDPFFIVENVPTWSVGGIGVYASGWRDAMVEDVLGFTDQFVNAFVEANPIIERE